MNGTDNTKGLVRKAEDFTLTARPPGASTMVVPVGCHLLDIYLGRTKGAYTIDGDDSFGPILPVSSFVFLPSGGPRDVHSCCSGWSMHLTFDERLLDQALADQPAVGSFDIRPISHANDAVMIALAKLFNGHWKDGIAPPSEAQTEAIVHLLAMRTVQHLTGNLGNGVPDALHSERIQRVVNFIEANLDATIALNDLASVAALSPFYFSRVFREATGRSPKQYVLERRLAKAERLLGQSDLPIVTIALECGFSSQSHMTDLFKRTLGMTPGSVRNSGC